MDGKTKAATVTGLVSLIESAILTLHSVRDTLTRIQEKTTKKPSEDEELSDKIRIKTLKLLKGET